MTKPGFKINQMPRLVPPNKNWSLCVGAGTSFPIFPSWDDLVIKLSNRLSINDAPSSFYKEFKPDTLIQILFNLSELNNRKFCTELSNALYSELEESFNSQEKDIIFDCLSDRIINNSIPKWNDYISLIETKYSKCSAIQIAKLIVDSYSHNIAPKAILSFNAEPLLYSLINAYTYQKMGKKDIFMDLINSSTTSLYKNRISYIFCHGTLPIPHTTPNRAERFTALEKLVFLENEYLLLSNSAYSWQSSSFIDVLSSSIVFFIGVSLSDPNMRRWLAWMHENKIKDIQNRTGKIVQDSNSHYWINKRPADSHMEKWYEASVSHLGIRIIWIDDWKEVGLALQKAVGL
nr:MAG TPA: SIR2 family protein [Caudoviricetes sp.]